MLKDLEKALMTAVVTGTKNRYRIEWLKGRNDLAFEPVPGKEPCGMVRGCQNLVLDPARSILGG